MTLTFAKTLPVLFGLLLVIIGMGLTYFNAKFEYLDAFKFVILYSSVAFTLYSLEIDRGEKKELYLSSRYKVFSVQKSKVLFNNFFRLISSPFILFFHIVAISFLLFFYESPLIGKAILFAGVAIMLVNTVLIVVYLQDYSSLGRKNALSLFVQIYILFSLITLSIVNGDSSTMTYFEFFPLNGIYCFRFEIFPMKPLLAIGVSIILASLIRKKSWAE